MDVVHLRAFAVSSNLPYGLQMGIAAWDRAESRPFCTGCKLVTLVLYFGPIAKMAGLDPSLPECSTGWPIPARKIQHGQP